MKKTLIILFLVFSAGNVFAQKKVLDHEAYDLWHSIEGHTISRDGQWISYYLEVVGGGDPVLKLKDTRGNQILMAKRGSSPQFTYDSKQLLFKIAPAIEKVKDLRRAKTKEEKLPKDTLAIYHLNQKKLEKIPRVRSYLIPEKWSGWIAYTLEPDLPENGKSDTTQNKEEKSGEQNKLKKVSKENGYHLVIRNLESAEQDTFRYVTDYRFAKEGAKLSFVTTGSDSTWLAGVYSYDFEAGEMEPVFRSEGNYKELTWDDSGNQFAFLADLDTTKVQIRPFKVHFWKTNSDTARAIAYAGHQSIPESWIIGEKGDLSFSKDGSRLYFGTSQKPPVQDTTLLEEEIVNVEVWSYEDGKLHTQQKVDREKDLNKTYTAVYHTASDKIVQLGQTEIPEIEFDTEYNAPKVLGMNNKPYLRFISWEGGPSYKDLYTVDTQTGQSEKFAERVRGNPRLSPSANYAIWYDRNDSAWFTYSVSQKKVYQITTNEVVPFYDELNDSPNHPRPYGMMSWTEDDEKVLIYDRYDIWEIDPENRTEPVNLTQNGRNLKRTYRYIKLDDEERFIKRRQELLLRAFNETDKSEGMFALTYGRQGLKELISANYRYRSFRKAENDDQLIFTKESFEVFPDLLTTDLSFRQITKISDANPQQMEYNWGTAELYNWTSLDGKPLEGLLIKPEDFDPAKKYPMIVNFYERSSDGLHRHRSPYPHRSTINYSFYASRGYVIFNPNVEYRIGYPGESAFNCVIPGVTSLIEEGFIDKDNIGAQGHSWGGYQVAYLVTKTDIFKAVEAGAPVPNMISAYGGIRWWTGLSRMFQYEHTQSRIGGSLWEYPVRFIENSPIFFVDKINTPVLIMHNDADGHVPWYQGIEFFVALRRLGKPAWMLNYQGEPHWPVKLQNRKDFVVRMQQYFDYYLKGSPKPDWMENGVPATDVGIDQHLSPADY